MTSSEEIKACCAAAYNQDAVALLLGESYHPGGLTLTRRLADVLGVRGGQRVLDVAAGPGTTARLLAREYGADVDGIDLGLESIERARSAAAADGLEGRVRFSSGDAERIPFADDTFDAVVCECAFCTFPGKENAAAEIARVLRPGGRVGITDVVVTGPLPAELRTLAAWVACIADARSVNEYAAYLADAGLTVTHTEQHDDALTRMLDQIETRIRVVAMTAPRRLRDAGIDTEAVGAYLGLVREAVHEGRIGYALAVAGADL